MYLKFIVIYIIIFGKLYAVRCIWKLFINIKLESINSIHPFIFRGLRAELVNKPLKNLQQYVKLNAIFNIRRIIHWSNNFGIDSANIHLVLRAHAIRLVRCLQNHQLSNKDLYNQSPTKLMSYQLSMRTIINNENLYNNFICDMYIVCEYPYNQALYY